MLPLSFQDVTWSRHYKHAVVGGAERSGMGRRGRGGGGEVGGGAERVYSITGGAHSLSSPLSPPLPLSLSVPLAIWSMIPSGTGSAGAHWCALAVPPSMKSGISSTATCLGLGFS